MDKKTPNEPQNSPGVTSKRYDPVNLLLGPVDKILEEISGVASPQKEALFVSLCLDLNGGERELTYRNLLQ